MYVSQFNAINSLGTRKGKKNTSAVDKVPPAVLIPMGLYEVIRISSLFLAIDENTNNELNKFADPICIETRVGNSTVFMVAYSAMLIKSWLRWMVKDDKWGHSVLVRVENKGKARATTNPQSIDKNKRCLRVLSRDFYISSARGDEAYANELLKCAEALYVHFLRVDSSVPNEYRLIVPDEIVAGAIPSSLLVTTPDNVASPERLAKFSHFYPASVAINPQQWSAFHSSEVKRFGYLNEYYGGRSASNVRLNQLSAEASQIHNSQSAARYYEHMVNIGAGVNMEEVFGANDDNMRVKSSGSTVNLAYIPQTSAKLTSNTTIRSTSYEHMVYDYQQLTGYPLNIKEEMKHDTLATRVADIDWILEIRKQNPTARFTHRVGSLDLKYNRAEELVPGVQLLPQNVQPALIASGQKHNTAFHNVLFQDKQVQPHQTSVATFQQPFAILTNVGLQQQPPKSLFQPANVLNPGGFSAPQKTIAAPNSYGSSMGIVHTTDQPQNRQVGLGSQGQQPQQSQGQPQGQSFQSQGRPQVHQFQGGQAPQQQQYAASFTQMVPQAFVPKSLSQPSNNLQPFQTTASAQSGQATQNAQPSQQLSQSPNTTQPAALQDNNVGQGANNNDAQSSQNASNANAVQDDDIDADQD